MDVYFNHPQLEAQYVAARTSVVVAGRRTGKTDSIAAPYVLKMMQRMPGSTGGIVVPTFKHGLTNTLPGMFAAWERWGYKRGIHFTVGRKGAQGFADPINNPEDNEQVIRFYNGSVAVLLSQDRTGAANSLTLAWLLVDEAKFIDPHKFYQETMPAMGGIKNKFCRHSFYRSMMILSDMPQTQRGSWFLNYEKDCNPRVIDTILAGVYEQWRIMQRIKDLREQGETSPAYLRKYLRELNTRINRLRYCATYYREYSSIENIQLIGEQYIRDMKRTLAPLTFQTSILCRKIGIAKDGFYSSMKESHKYNASDFAYLDSLDYNARDGANSSLADADVNPDAPICIGMDYNANINWIVAGQPDYSINRLNVIKSFYVKYERKIPALIDDFCRYYASHRNKTVVYYYDSTALGSNYAISQEDFRANVVTRFRTNGWDVIDIALGNPMRHDEKYNLINTGFQGLNALQPFFNRQNNDDLILAIQAAGVEIGRNGFRKNKAGEKLVESEDSRLEHRTDGTDAFDTLYIGCLSRPVDPLSYVEFTGFL